MKPIDKVMRQGLVSLYKDLTGVKLKANADYTKVIVKDKSVTFTKEIYNKLLEDAIETFKSLGYNANMDGKIQ